MKGLAELFGKKMKERGPLSEKEAAARESVYNDLEDMADEGIGEGIKSVKVMAKDKKGLEEGLEKAKDLMKKDSHIMSDGEEMSDEEMEKHSHIMPDGEEMSDEEIEEMEKMLAEAKAKRAAKK